MKKIVLLLSCFWVGTTLACTLSYDSPIIKLVPPVSKNSAAFLKISNSSDKDIKILRVESDLANVIELHTMNMDHGVMSMRPMDFVLVPKKKDVELKPGGMHIMLLGLKKPLTEGQKAEMTFVYEDGGKQKVVFEVTNLNSK